MMIAKKSLQLPLVVLCFIAFLISINLTLHAQAVASTSVNNPTISSLKFEDIQPLSLGDRVPSDLVIKNIINFPSSTFRISDFKGKLILIDFWGTTCSSCISALPKFDSLQRVYKNRMQVLTVTNSDSKESVFKILKRFNKTRNFQLPIIIDSKVLKKYFPHEIISHVVWIDSNGIVKAITGTEYVTGSNIEKVLMGEKIAWPIKRDVLGFNYEKPFFAISQHQISQPNFIFYSAFTGHIDGINSTEKTLVDSLNNTITKNYYNLTLLQLCDISLLGTGAGYIDSKKVILDVSDPTRFVNKGQFLKEWVMKNTYCYSISYPVTLTKDRQMALIRDDLTRWLGLLGFTCKKDKKSVKCLALVRTTKDSSLLISKGTKFENRLANVDGKKWLKNSTLSRFVGFINGNSFDIPWIFDETGFSKDTRVDIEFDIESFDNLPQLCQELKRYGLALIDIYREMEMCLITEREWQR